ncbi:MAG TPA: flagellar hook-length control protein FliK [Terriglobia bacterium]|nr:flagellar hook-length control protein FliK [Terriglobia bacterium]
MNARAVQTEISSMREIASDPGPAPVKGVGSFENYFSRALKATEPASDSKSSERQHSSKAETAHSPFQPVHVPTPYAQASSDGWNSLNDLVASATFSSSLTGASETATRSSLRSASKSPRSEFPSLAGEDEEGAGATSGDSLLKLGLSENPDPAPAANTSDSVVNQASPQRSPGQSAENPNSALTSSDSYSGAHNAQNTTRRTESSAGALAQDEDQMERALASLETMGLSVPSAVTSAERVSMMTTASTKIASMSSASNRNETPIVSTSAKSVSEKPAEQNPSQTVGKGGQPSKANASDEASASGDSQGPAKAASGPSGDNSRNSSAQQYSSKPPNSSSAQTTSTGNANGSNATTTSLAAQVANSGSSQALNQAAQATNPASHPGASSPATASQPGAPDKMEAAIENRVDAGGVINSASLMQSQGKTEMHVAMQTDTLGALQLHAVLDNGQLGASIQVVSHDAHTVLTNDLPALQQVLKDQNLRIDHLAVINSPMTSGAGAQNGRNSNSEDFNQSGNQNSHWLSNPLVPTMPGDSGEALPLENRVGRLSVRA